MEPISIALALAEFAPQIVKWVTGNEKAEEAAGIIVDVAKEVTGKATGQDALAAVRDNPNLALEFRRAVFKHEERMTQLMTEDLKNARKMQETALQQDDLFSKRYVYYFASAWSVFAMMYILGITFFELPKGSVRFADTILGFLLGTVVAAILQFFFGSSNRSSFKDDLIRKLSTK